MANLTYVEELVEKVERGELTTDDIDKLFDEKLIDGNDFRNVIKLLVRKEELMLRAINLFTKDEIMNGIRALSHESLKELHAVILHKNGELDG